MSARAWWGPALVLAAGAVLASVSGRQREMPLRADLPAALPASLAGMAARDVQIPAADRRAAGVDDALMRVYAPAAGAGALSLYVGYYRSQARGRTIHSPRNCLPGAGWEPVSARRARIATAAGTVEVNRFLMQRNGQRALVLYWYQGRGRVEAGEYAVKWNLLRDAALRRRTEEALVRVIVPVTGNEDEAFRLAARAAAASVPAVARALPS